MIDFLGHIVFTCLVGTGIGFLFLIVVGLCKLINSLTKGKFEETLVNLFSGGE